MTSHLANLLRVWVGGDCDDLTDYLARLEAGFECPEEALVVAAVYVLRLASVGGNSRNSGRRVDAKKAFLASLSLAVKFLYDDGERPGTSACVRAYAGGVTVAELSRLENDLLAALEWRLFVGDAEYFSLRASVTPPPSPPASWLLPSPTPITTPHKSPCWDPWDASCVPGDSRAAAWGVGDPIKATPHPPLGESLASSDVTMFAAGPLLAHPDTTPPVLTETPGFGASSSTNADECSDGWMQFVNFAFVDTAGPWDETLV